ncbi:hypothetical protein HU200_042794 [Digitaria exilis]|uniref:glycerophosphodiester phosphodiesterase n=1 Tax=Digitaria exilis TaxID=1010633 RepID=A0A835BBN2_9POAL|nr:hypothetical protein HU200_042794 [Digitaria exilis]
MQNAPYLATRGIAIVDAVSSALINPSYDKRPGKQVLIASDDSAVLGAFNKFPSLEGGVLHISNVISDASKPSVEEVAKFAMPVSISRGSVVQAHGSFLVQFTDVIHKMRAAKLSVYVGVLKNEFMNLGFDFWGNPMWRSDFSKNLSYTIFALHNLSPVPCHPAQGPAPVLEAADVVDPPLPPLHRLQMIQALRAAPRGQRQRWSLLVWSLDLLRSWR